MINEKMYSQGIAKWYCCSCGCRMSALQNKYGEYKSNCPKCGIWIKRTKNSRRSYTFDVYYA